MSKVLLTNERGVITKEDMAALAASLGGVVVPAGIDITTLGETQREVAMRLAISYIAAKNGSHPQASIVQLAEEIHQFLIKE